MSTERAPTLTYERVAAGAISLILIVLGWIATTELTSINDRLDAQAQVLQDLLVRSGRAEERELSWDRRMTDLETRVGRIESTCPAPPDLRPR